MFPRNQLHGANYDLIALLGDVQTPRRSRKSPVKLQPADAAAGGGLVWREVVGHGRLGQQHRTQRVGQPHEQRRVAGGEVQLEQRPTAGNQAQSSPGYNIAVKLLFITFLLFIVSYLGLIVPQ